MDIKIVSPDDDPHCKTESLIAPYILKLNKILYLKHRVMRALLLILISLEQK